MFDGPLLQRTLLSLLEAAQHNELDDQALATIQQFLHSSYAESITQIVDALNNFDFTVAVSLLESLLRKLENCKARHENLIATLARTARHDSGRDDEPNNLEAYPEADSAGGPLPIICQK